MLKHGFCMYRHVHTCACPPAPTHALPPKLSFQMTLQNDSQAQEPSEHGSYRCSLQKPRKQSCACPGSSPAHAQHEALAVCLGPFLIPDPYYLYPFTKAKCCAHSLVPSAFQTYLTLSQHPDVGIGRLSGLLCIYELAKLRRRT